MAPAVIQSQRRRTVDANSNQELIEEVREMKKMLCYFIWAVGAMLNIRPPVDSQGQVQPIDVTSPDAKLMVDNALVGFASVVKLAMECHQQPVPPVEMK
jgi:hypothetical protein